jgi:ubiquinone/menaquinone biosynthesis C-methylase UbiE
MNRLPVKPVRYDRIAPTYDQRYAASPLEGVGKALVMLADNLKAARVLEAGCGTGHWLVELNASSRMVYGLDLSPVMLTKARQKGDSFHLVCGQASYLPYPAAVFDLVFCVNALHHFERPGSFVSDARRLLRPEGALAIVGMDPHTGQDRWYLYDYFEGTLAVDLNRFPSSGRVLDWMVAAGFRRVERQPVEKILHRFIGREVLDDPFLQKNSTSQLVLLSDIAYEDGIRRIEQAITDVKDPQKPVDFWVDITLYLVCGFL